MHPMQWSAPCSNASGMLRKEFSQWSIPKALRDEFGVRDGDKCVVTIAHLSLSWTFKVKVTSGGEIRVPVSKAEQLKHQAQVHPSTSISFGLSFEDEKEAAHELFENEVAASRKLSSAKRRERLAKAPKKPKIRRVLSTIFDRNPDVVAEVLERANGMCERCNNPAPFTRMSDGTPYLEVHHRLQLAHGGDDTVENTTALCPNCHRQSHYGQLDA